MATVRWKRKGEGPVRKGKAFLGHESNIQKVRSKRDRRGGSLALHLQVGRDTGFCFHRGLVHVPYMCYVYVLGKFRRVGYRAAGGVHVYSM